MKYNIIYLAGFMGAGKSTIGPILANTIGWDFYDLDHFIENKTGKKIKNIFEDQGEAYFRKLETETLQELSGGTNYIIALGGGTIASKANLQIIKTSGKIIYLKSSPEHIYERLKHKRDRPVLMNSNGESLTKDELTEKIRTLLNERKKYYESADFTIDTDNIPIGRTVDQIAHIILHNV